MQIQWLGYSAFRFQSDGTTVITDPIDALSGTKINKQGAAIVIASNRDTDPASAVIGTPFTIEAPGEYEVKSVFVRGVAAGKATIYVITIDDVHIAFLGGVAIKELSEAQLGLLEGSDILILPVGGGPVTSAKDAVAIINQIEPRLVIPSYYKISGSKGLDSVEVFLKEYSAPREEMEKLKVSRKDLPQEDTRVVILKS